MNQNLRSVVFHCEIEDKDFYFQTNAPQDRIDSCPEIEWHIVKRLLIAYGYDVIEKQKINLN